MLSEFSPSPYMAKLMLLASCAQYRESGPWLTAHSHRSSGEGVMYRIDLVNVSWFHHSRMIAIDADEVLAFVVDQEWQTPLDPTVRQVDDLCEYIVRARDLPLWMSDYAAWVKWYCDPVVVKRRQENAAAHHAAARALRWKMAEQWMAIP